MFEKSILWINPIIVIIISNIFESLNGFLYVKKYDIQIFLYEWESFYICSFIVEFVWEKLLNMFEFFDLLFKNELK